MDGRHSQSFRLSLSAALDHQPDRLVGHEPGWIDRYLAVRRTQAPSTSNSTALETSGAAWINDQFGGGIITWNTPFLFRTRPEGSRLLVGGPVNRFKPYAQPLTALIESDWMTMSFTMNWKILLSNQPVRFEPGEPLFQVIPLISNVCSDLEAASVTYQRLAEAPEVYQAYQAWNEGRQFSCPKGQGGSQARGMAKGLLSWPRCPRANLGHRSHDQGQTPRVRFRSPTGRPVESIPRIPRRIVGPKRYG